jgi:hypothetical protein
VGAAAADADGGHQREAGCPAVEGAEDRGNAAVVDAPGGVGAAIAAVGEDDGVDAREGRVEGVGLLEVACAELGAGQEPLRAGRVADQRADVEAVPLGGGDDAAADAAGGDDDEHGGR